jgi:hypothetical protein
VLGRAWRVILPFLVTSRATVAEDQLPSQPVDKVQELDVLRVEHVMRIDVHSSSFCVSVWDLNVNFPATPPVGKECVHCTEAPLRCKASVLPLLRFPGLLESKDSLSVVVVDVDFVHVIKKLLDHMRSRC